MTDRGTERMGEQIGAAVEQDGGVRWLAMLARRIGLLVAAEVERYYGIKRTCPVCDKTLGGRKRIS